MGVLDRTIIVHILLGLGAVSVGLCALLWLSQSLQFVDLIVNKGLPASTFVYLTLLLLPSLLIFVLPLAMFAVTLFVYNRLWTDRELVVMSAAGMGPARLVRPALAAGLVGMVLAYGLTLKLAPDSVLAFRELRWTIRHDVSQILLQEGEFNDIAPGITVYVRGRQGDGTLTGVMVSDLRDPDVEITVMAEGGRLIYNADVARVYLTDGVRQEIKPDSGQSSTLYFETYAIDFTVTGEPDHLRFRDARERPLLELLTLDDGPNLRDVDIRRFRVEAHQRLTLPLLVLGGSLLAATVMLLGGFNRRGQGVRLSFAVLLMALVQAGALGAAQAATGNLVLIPALYANALVPLLACGVALAQGQKHRLREPKMPPDSAS